MLHLEHLNLVVKDIPASIKFYAAAFPHWQVRGSGEAEWYGVIRQWVHFGDAYQYLTLNNDGEGENRDITGHQVGLSHFGFTIIELDSVIQRLNDAGYSIKTEGAEDKFRRNVYFLDPNGFEVEFVEYLSDNPLERNRYDDY